MKPVRRVDQVAWVPRMLAIPSSEVHPQRAFLARESARIANEFLARMVRHA